ncbi:unnamed protein product [Lathyrus sativus]|nr:unnamed protein product [Lathyrus sativus]
MARPFEKICDISDKKELWKIVVKVHHKWTIVSNSKKHLEFVFVDVEGKDIHVIVPTTLKGTFDLVLQGNNMYIVTNFQPQPNDLVFKTYDHQFIIRFTSGTSVSDINKHDIPAKKLNFKHFVDIFRENGQRIS